jgi:hypothetical protein
MCRRPAVEWDRGFESGSLQRRVQCELVFPRAGAPRIMRGANLAASEVSGVASSTAKISWARWRRRRCARRSSRLVRNLGSNTAPTSTTCHRSPAIASGGASRPAAGQRRAHLFATGVKATQFANRHQDAGAPRRLSEGNPKIYAHFEVYRL